MSAHQSVRAPSVRIGCSGWQYRHWRGDFYPAALPAARWLEYYAGHFDTVEVNNTFYNLPEAPTFAEWARRTPPRFLYAVKASRYLTHMKKLKDPKEPLHRFFTRARRLGPKLGPVLYQLPPRWPVNLERFRTFLRALPKGRRHVVEFREPSWYSDEVFALMERHDVSVCLHDMTGSASGRLDVGPIVYVRFHGTTKYAGRYDDAALGSWAEWLGPRAKAGKPVFAYFNNDVGGHAPRDAKRLRDLVTKRLR
jgi:uncharacterized protein YecE (DUF72 family)